MVYEIYCEWDIGHEELRFSNETLAENWILENLTLKEMYNSEVEFNNFEGTFLEYIDTLYDESLLGINGYTVV